MIVSLSILFDPKVTHVHYTVGMFLAVLSIFISHPCKYHDQLSIWAIAQQLEAVKSQRVHMHHF